MGLYSTLIVWFVLLVLSLPLSSCEDKKKEVVQAGQPTSFHMEDRGPEIQVTADSEGVKINAKPSGLNVEAKPGPNTIVEDKATLLQPVVNNPQIMRFNNDPVAYNNNGLNGPSVSNSGVGLAARGDMSAAATYTPNIMSGPVNTNGLQLANNGNLGPGGNPGPERNFYAQMYPAATAFNSANSPVQLPSDYVDYLRWKAGLNEDNELLDRLYHPHRGRRHRPHYGHRRHRHRTVNNFYFPGHHDDDDDDYYDDDDDYY